MDGLKIEYIPVGKIKPYEKNARKHKDFDVDAIVRSIEEFGFDDPIGIWSDQNIIVEGHGRLLAAKKLGMKEVPCIRLDHLTDEQRRAYALAHNKTAENSEWDLELLPLELEEIVDIDMTQFGFDVPADEPEIEEDEVPDVPEEPTAKLGDIYQLGRHRLMCGDSWTERWLTLPFLRLRIMLERLQQKRTWARLQNTMAQTMTNRKKNMLRFLTRTLRLLLMSVTSCS